MLAEVHRARLAARPAPTPVPAPAGVAAPRRHAPDLRQLAPAPGAALFNLGNSCYLNAVLQCLTHAPPWADFCAARGHRSACHAPLECVACLLEAHVVGARAGGELWPRALHRQLPRLSPDFLPGRQEDAHELYVQLLDCAERHSRLRRDGGAAPGAPPGARSHVATFFEGAMCSEASDQESGCGAARGRRGMRARMRGRTCK